MSQIDSGAPDAPKPILSQEAALAGLAMLSDAVTRVADALDENPKLGVIRTIPATTPMAPPEIVDEEVAPDDGAPPPVPAYVEPAPNVKVGAPDPAATPVLSDAEIYNKVGLFLDPAAPAPIFISPAIEGRVFIGLYPNYSEVLRAQALASRYEANAEDDVGFMIGVVSELVVVIKGWLYEHEPALATIRATPDLMKWPPIRTFTVLDSRDPGVQARLLALWGVYIAWKETATPTAAEMEKFSARKG